MSGLRIAYKPHHAPDAFPTMHLHIVDYSVSNKHGIHLRLPYRYHRTQCFIIVPRTGKSRVDVLWVGQAHFSYLSLSYPLRSFVVRHFSAIDYSESAVVPYKIWRQLTNEPASFLQAVPSAGMQKDWLRVAMLATVFPWLPWHNRYSDAMM